MTDDERRREALEAARLMLLEMSKEMAPVHVLPVYREMVEIGARELLSWDARGRLVGLREARELFTSLVPLGKAFVELQTRIDAAFEAECGE